MTKSALTSTGCRCTLAPVKLVSKRWLLRRRSLFTHAFVKFMTIRSFRTLMLGLGLLAASTPLTAQTPDAQVRAAVERYNAAFTTRDLPTLKALLAEDIVLYEHSVRNIGLADVWENHLRPEVEAFENTTARFTNVRVTSTPGMALVTREYAIHATMNGKPIDAQGNETMVWVRRDARWVVTHIHYSHPCPRPALAQ